MKTQQWKMGSKIWKFSKPLKFLLRSRALPQIQNSYKALKRCEII